MQQLSQIVALCFLKKIDRLFDRADTRQAACARHDSIARLALIQVFANFVDLILRKRSLSPVA